MDRYIGLGAHASSCTLAVVSGRGKRLARQVVETNARCLIEGRDALRHHRALDAAALLGARHREAARLRPGLMRDLLQLHAAAAPETVAWPVYRMALLYLALLFAAMALDIAVRTPVARVATLFQ